MSTCLKCGGEIKMMIIISLYPRVGVSAVWLRWLTVLLTLLPVSISSRWFRKSLNPLFLRSHKSRTNDWCSARLLRIISMTTALCVCVCFYSTCLDTILFRNILVFVGLELDEDRVDFFFLFLIDDATSIITI